jgi:hypothetical protein
MPVLPRHKAVMCKPERELVILFHLRASKRSGMVLSSVYNRSYSTDAAIRAYREPGGIPHGCGYGRTFRIS